MILSFHARLLGALLLTLSVHARAQPIDLGPIDPAEHAYDHWYLDTLDDKPIGYWRCWLRVEDERIQTGYEILRVERHGGERMQSLTRVQWTETLHYKPIAIHIEQADGSDTVTRTYTFTDAGLTLTSKQDGRTIVRQLPPIQGDYLTAAQEAITTDLRLKRGDKAFKLNSFDPAISMTPFVTRYKRSAEQDQTLTTPDGQRIDAACYTRSFSMLPGFEMRCWVDGKGNQLKSAFESAGMQRASRLADASIAEMDFDPPELAGRSVVVPDRAIEKPDRQRRVVYELSYEAGDADIAPVTTAHQSVEVLGKGKVRITVDLDAQPDKQALEADRPTDANLRASIALDHNDPAVQKLAQSAIAKLDKDDATASTIADACRRLVSTHITGGTLTVGNATASEAARTGKGDCTEQAVLLAALLRAHGIPSRCVTGLAYTEEGFANQRNVFVYHMWAQAWIENKPGQGRWVDLDAALWRYDATHIALGVSDMGDDNQADAYKLIPMMQGLKIDVVEMKAFPKNPDGFDPQRDVPEPEFEG